MKIITKTRMAFLRNTLFVTDKTSCWLWTGYISNNGYGQSHFNGKFSSAHRTSWMIYNGKIPKGLQVNHKCDVRNCVRPDHLFLGTQKDNMQDASRKGRMREQKKTQCPRGHSLSGENLIIKKEGSRACRECKNSLRRKNTKQKELLGNKASINRI